jgi:hypothetical protein
MSGKSLKPQGPATESITDEAYHELAQDSRFLGTPGHHAIANTDARLTNPGTTRKSANNPVEHSIAKQGVKPTAPSRQPNTVVSHRVKGSR